MMVMPLLLPRSNELVAVGPPVNVIQRSAAPVMVAVVTAIVADAVTLVDNSDTGSSTVPLTSRLPIVIVEPLTSSRLFGASTVKLPGNAALA
jgi:hypothetical protein